MSYLRRVRAGARSRTFAGSPVAAYTTTYEGS